VHRLGDILELRCAEIGDLEVEPLLHLTIGVLGKTDRAGLRDAFEPRGNVDAVAHQVAVAFLDNIAEMNSDAIFDAPLGRHTGVALDEAVLHLDGAAHGVHHAPELDDRAVSGALDDAPVMNRDDGVDEIAAQGSQARKNAILVRSREPAIPDDIRNQNRRELPGLAHRAPLAEAWHKNYRPNPGLLLVTEKVNTAPEESEEWPCLCILPAAPTAAFWRFSPVPGPARERSLWVDSGGLLTPTIGYHSTT